MARPLLTTPEPLGTSSMELERVTEKALGLVERDIEADDTAEPGGPS